MQLKNEHHSFTGMQRDLDISKHPANFLYDGRNIRLTARGDDTLLAITNEKGPSQVLLKEEDGSPFSIQGTCIGHCLLNKYLVLFTTTGSTDYILRVDLETDTVVQLYSGDNERRLGFRTDFKIDAIASYENANIQKVYWVDGENQPRMINILAPYDDYNKSSFDFIPELALKEEVSVYKLFNGKSLFPAGVLQYAFTYFNKYGTESNIFYTTPLIYTSHYDRAGSPEDSVSNAFRIQIRNLDTKFQYLRVYSIIRTSLNATTIAKRVVDILIDKETVEFIDNNDLGEAVDPTHLLYVGGEEIAAGTICQKDGTLFLGNITFRRKPIDSEIEAKIQKLSVVSTRESRYFKGNEYDAKSTKGLNYINTLSPSKETVEWKGASGFKYKEHYKLGIQFQHKSGKWSDPVYLGNNLCDNYPSIEYSGNEYVSKIPIFSLTIPEDILGELYSEGYRRARALYADPSNGNTTILCQGVASPTVWTENLRLQGDSKDLQEPNGTLYSQSSWLFRYPVETPGQGTDAGYGGYATYNGELCTQFDTYLSDGSKLDPSAPVSGDRKNGVASYYLKSTEIMGSFKNKDRFIIDSDFITIHSPETEFIDSPDLTNYRVRRVGAVTLDKTYGAINIQTSSAVIGQNTSGADNFNSVIDTGGSLISGPFFSDSLVQDEEDDKFVPYAGGRWAVFMWHKTGSLNNDINREGQSAKLYKKKISNYRASSNTVYSDIVSYKDSKVELFNSDQVTITKLDSKTYLGNIDSMLIPMSSSFYYTKDDNRDSKINHKLNSSGAFVDNGTAYDKDPTITVGDKVPALRFWKEGVRMKYKSTPHFIAYLNDVEGVKYPAVFPTEGILKGLDVNTIPLVELYRDFDEDTFFGGKNDEVLKNISWIPCGDPVSFSGNVDIPVLFQRGDTFFQRFECLKTYAFTPEDENQVIEIASFMCETRVNVDGRYDRNRGQIDNTNMSPENFNLINPVYSQKDNFFTYRILDKGFYDNDKFPNQITWSKEKQSGADVDSWTNITLASVYDMDGSKGEITSLNTWKDNIYCFQNKGVSNILFNSRVQIPTSDGVPIEISNSYKVDGYRYISDGIGCDSITLVKETPSGIYFLDSIGKHLFHIGDNIGDITSTHNMSSVFKEKGSTYDRILYDNINHDVYLTSDTESLCFSEVLGQFTSFMDYDRLRLIETHNNHVFTLRDQSLYRMFEGEYNKFFNKEPRPWHFTFISNGLDSGACDLDKIFSNIDYRMDMSDDTNYRHLNSLDFIRVFNEYQDTEEVSLTKYSKVDNTWKYSTKNSLQKKFRVWRIQIPRDSKRKLDRIRNTWCKITLGSKTSNNYQSVLHDLNVQYYL